MMYAELSAPGVALDRQPRTRGPCSASIDQFTQFAPALTILPDRLNRSVVPGVCRRAAAGAVGAEQAFLAAMAWGDTAGWDTPGRDTALAVPGGCSM